MATPGWYPDPAGRPGAFRYWDGQGWGADVTDNPYAAPPGAAPAAPGPVAPVNPFDAPTVYPGSTPAPPTATPGGQPAGPPPHQPYQSYAAGPGQQYRPGPGGSPTPGQPSWAVQPGAGGPGGQGGNTGRNVGLVVLAVVLTIILGVGTFFVVRTLTDDDETSAGDDPTSQTTGTTDDPTTDPSTEPTGDPSTEATTDPTTEPSDDALTDPGDPFADDTQPSAQECAGGAPTQGVTGISGGQQTGGGLAMPTVRGFSAGESFDQAAAFTFADGVVAPSRLIVDGWVAVYALGGLDRANGFESPGQAAAAVLECMTLSQDFYRSLSSAELLDSQATTVDGNPAWVMDAEIRVEDPQINIDGDIAKVVVVDTGDPERYGVFVSVVPIGRQGLITQQQNQAGTLTVQ